MNNACPLCETDSKEAFSRIDQRYLICPKCDLTFVNRNDVLVPAQEQLRYELHDNSIRSKGYLNFLYRLINPINNFVKDKTKNGLDFGSGPYPMLIELLNEEGFKNIKGFDPFFQNNLAVWNENYDFITCCEVLEHVNELKKTFENLLGHLNSGGFLIVSSGIAPEKSKDRENWHYILDPTHISLFSEITIGWMAKKYDLTFEFLEKDLFIFWKTTLVSMG